MTDSKRTDDGKGEKPKKLTLNKETLKDLTSNESPKGGRAAGGDPATTCRGSALACPSDPHCA